MSIRPAPNVADPVRLQMERSIDDLAELARSEVESGRFFAEVLRRALQPGGASHVVLWRPTIEGQWQPIAEMPASALDAERISARQELLNEVSGDQPPRIIPETSTESQVLSPLRHSGSTVGILETIHPLPPAGGLSPVTFQFFAALCEIAADFLSQQELQQLRRARSIWQQWDQFQLRLGQSLDLATVCATIANDGRIIAECDRIAVLIRHGRRYLVQSISGVDRLDPRSGGVQSLEIMVNQLSKLDHTFWSTDAELNSGAFASVRDRYCQESGAACFGVVPLTSPAGKNSRVPAEAAIVFESFSPDETWKERQSRSEALVQRSGFALTAAIERSQIPLLITWQRLQRRNPLRRPGLVMGALALAAVFTSLAVVPAEFTVSGQGELWPELRRDVFASTNGVVDKILVNHGDQVQLDQPLIVLRDPDLEQDIPRIAGEMATLKEKLRGVQLARLAGGTTPEAVARIRQLTADEEELKERLKTLERQRLLVEERRERLTLRSPISGRVFTWDTTQHLSARPVERGQALLTVGETEGPWIVEVLVADKDAGYMLRAQKKLGAALKVEFQLPSEPGRTCVGIIRDVALATESDDRSNGHVRVVVEFDRSQIQQLRPRATAIPRIYCGQQSLGYVWFHDLIDAIRLHVLF